MLVCQNREEHETSRRSPSGPQTRRIWTDFGNRDPFWYVLSSGGRRGGKWSQDEFFQTGLRSVESVFERLGELVVPVNHQVALDFGCGVGRLTQPLADRFATVYGVDISPSMIANAERYNRHGKSCKYVVNLKEDLSIFSDDTFDFILSDVVLQHVRPALAKRYITEFVRVLKPGGVAVYFLPGTLLKLGRGPWLVSAYNWLRYREATTLDYGVMQAEVIRIVESSSSVVLDIREGDWLDRGQTATSPRPGLLERFWLKSYTTLTDQWEGTVYIIQKGTDHGK